MSVRMPSRMVWSARERRGRNVVAAAVAAPSRAVRRVKIGIAGLPYQLCLTHWFKPVRPADNGQPDPRAILMRVACCHFTRNNLWRPAAWLGGGRAGMTDAAP